MFHDPFRTVFVAHQVRDWAVHIPNFSGFSLVLNLSLEPSTLSGMNPHSRDSLNKRESTTSGDGLSLGSTVGGQDYK